MGASDITPACGDIGKYCETVVPHDGVVVYKQTIYACANTIVRIDSQVSRRAKAIKKCKHNTTQSMKNDEWNQVLGAIPCCHKVMDMLMCLLHSATTLYTHSEARFVRHTIYHTTVGHESDNMLACTATTQQNILLLFMLSCWWCKINRTSACEPV